MPDSYFCTIAWIIALLAWRFGGKDSQPNYRTPSLERQIAIQAQVNENTFAGRPPYHNVHLRTRGEVEYALHREGWTGSADTHLPRANLRGVNLRFAILDHIELIGADLREADLTGASFFRANLIMTNFTRADCTDTCFQRSLSCHAMFMGCQLLRTDFVEADLDGATFAVALLDCVRFDAASMQKTSFDHASFRNTELARWQAEQTISHELSFTRNMFDSEAA
jgi:uncharacterized protein YjbI with pentapeptide repeats